MDDNSLAKEYFPAQPVRLNDQGNVVQDFNNISGDMFRDALRIVIESGKASASLLQRRLSIGYARAARLIEEMETQEIINPADGARPRDVLINMSDIDAAVSRYKLEMGQLSHASIDTPQRVVVTKPKTDDEKLLDVVSKLEQDSGFQEAIIEYQSWVKIFFEITERKVSILDAYGDENWDALYEEIATLLTKVYKQERSKGKSIGIFDTEYYLSPGNTAQRFSILAKSNRFLAFLGLYLEIRFKEHYVLNKDTIGQRSIYMSFDSLSGIEFEGYVARLLKALGYNDVTGTPVTGDQGADLVAKKDGIVYIIQAKRYSKPVGNSAIQEVVGALKFYNGQYAWVITNSKFTPGAVSLAQKNHVKLTDGQGIATLIKEIEGKHARKLVQ